MQKTYVTSIFIKNYLDWPVEPNEVVIFKGLRNVQIGRKEHRFFGPSQLESLLVTFSFAPFSLILSSPLLGKLDIFIKTSTLRSSLKVDKELPNELDITELFRTHFYRLLYCPTEDYTISEKIPVTLGSLISTQRLKIGEDYYWDYFLQAFLKGNAPFDVQSLPVSCIFTTATASWYTSLCTSSFYEVVNKIPTLPAFSLSYRVPTILVVDSQAPPINYKILTLEVLKSLQYLRITPDTFRKWNNERLLITLDGTTTAIMELRKVLTTIEFSPRYCLHPSNIHWRSMIIEDGLSFQGYIPKADWYFLINSSTKSWVTGIHEDISQLRNCIKKILQKEILPEQWEQIRRTSWRIPLLKKRLMIRLIFYNSSVIERSMTRETLEPMYTSFGLVQLPNKEWSSKAGLLRLYKKDGILASEHLDDCLEGFALENAKVLMQANKPQCIICATNFCNTFLDNCGHSFCESCVQTLLNTNIVTCPSCRTEIQGTTQIRRATPRKQETLQFSKKQQLVTLIQNLKGTIAIVVPDEICHEQVLEWLKNYLTENIYVLHKDSYVPKIQYDHVLCSTCILPDIFVLDILHFILQNYSTDCTTMHVLVGKGTNADEEEDHKWVKEFSKCYSNMIEMSSYSE